MGLVRLYGVPYNAGARPETTAVVDEQNGPSAIRTALKRNVFSAYDIDLAFEDQGDVKCDGSVGGLLESVESCVSKVRKEGDVPFLMGGAHTLTLGALRAIAKSNPDFSLIYFDTHPDLMPRTEIDYGSCIFHAIQEDVIDPKRLAFIGLRQVEKAEWQLLKDNDIFFLHSLDFERLSTTEVLAQIKDRCKPPFYLSVDLDVIDPSQAPGVGSPFPGGLSVREVSFLTTELCRQEIVGLDVVELAPISDREEETATVAASLLQRCARAIGAKARKH